MSRVVMIMLQRERARNVTYDRIILVRPDGKSRLYSPASTR